MHKALTIAVAQPRTIAFDVVSNARAHARAIHAAQARVVVFPELSLTGYELDAQIVTTQDQRIAPIVEACALTGSLALVGAPVLGTSIGVLAIDGAGATVVYRKVYLHKPGEAHFRPGGGPAVIEVDGWRLGLAVCRDTGIPEHAARTAALGMDGYVAGVVHAAHESELHGERARRVAREHGVWVATAASAGPTGGFEKTSGRSGIWSATGQLITEAGMEPDEVVRAEFVRDQRG